MTHTSLGRLGAADASGDPDLDLRAIARAIRRRWLLVLGLTVLAALASYMVVSNMTPLYTAEARLLIESRENAFTRPLQQVERIQLDRETVESQAQILVSRDLARSVIDRLDLAAHAEFEDRPSLLARALSVIGLGAGSRSDERRLVDAFQERLTVYEIGESRVISVNFDSADPDLAAAVVNALAEGYIAMQREAERDTTRLAGQWLESEIDRLRARVEEAERSVEAFRANSGLYRGAGEASLSGQQLSELNQRLAELRAQRSQVEARAEAIRQMLASGEPIEGTSEVLDSALVQRLQESQADLQARLAEASSTYLPQHPRMRELRAQLGDISNQIRDEVAKVARSLETEAGMTGVRESALTARLDSLKADAARVNEDEVTLRALEREAAAERELLESYLARYNEASARASFGGIPVDARLISRASVPSTPSFPQVAPIVAAVTLATLLVVLGVLVFAELVSGRAFAPASGAAPQPSGLPRLTFVEGRRASDRVAAGAVLRGAVLTSHEALAERLGMPMGEDAAMRASFLALRQADLPRAIVGTARAMSARGLRVVMVDAAGGGLADLVDPRPEIGLAQLLDGQASFTSVLFRDAFSRAHVIPDGGMPALPGDGVRGRLDMVLDALRQTYDAVLIAGGAHGSAWAEILVAASDMSVLVGEDEARLRRALPALGGPGAAVAFVCAPAQEGEEPSLLPRTGSAAA